MRASTTLASISSHICSFSVGERGLLTTAERAYTKLKCLFDVNMNKTAELPVFLDPWALMWLHFNALSIYLYSVPMLHFIRFILQFYVHIKGSYKTVSNMFHNCDIYEARRVIQNLIWSGFEKGQTP